MGQNGYVLWCSCQGVQAAQQVGFQIIQVFQADGDANQALAYASGLALLFGQPAMRGAGRVGDGGLHITEVGGDRAQQGAVDHVEGISTELLGPLAHHISSVVALH